jgi:hypothetical protein
MRKNRLYHIRSPILGGLGWRISACTSHASFEITPSGAIIETGVFHFQGRDFSATGSIRDEARGFIAGYVREIAPGQYEIATWGGEKIADLRLVRSWRYLQWRRRWTSTHVLRFGYAWRATIGGREYHGRNGGASMLVRMYARK